MNAVNPNYNNLRKLIADAIDVDEEEVTPDAHFIDDIGVDSLISLEVLVRLEREYKIRISEVELPRLVSLNEVFTLLESKNVV